ncbi:alpha/beta hydrolase [Muricauda oceani]|uniref:Alpha/beta hydrolase n=1 Tax=Flagellimonas oceani TaxID=2698672 RepID=A0A6G7IZR2_9FLAO|nr:alpha/beta hydrolase [Allomuricauda oceani]MBW8244798.1 alpha/beta hydrolase [Allomuricauda oceani]QII43890.1 alpha/beta hydrolase [Allomuricauda oceani]
MKKSIQSKLAVTCFTVITGTASAQAVLNPDVDPAIEKETKAFLHALNSSGGDPMETMDPEDARKVLEGAQSSVEVDLSGISVEEKTIVQDGISVKIYIVRPEGKTGKLPVFMFFHGGGWVLGDFATHKRFVRDLVVYSEVASVFVEYSRSPEVKYPTAINEAYAATKWISEHGNEVNLDGKNLAIAGNSAGGNLTAVVAQMAKDKNGPKIKFQVLFWPVTNFNVETASYNQYAESRFLTKNMMIWFWDHYLQTKAEGKEKYASPLQATLEDMKGLPPTLVQTAENDVLRDEGEAYARKLNEAGVPVSLVRMQGMIHDYGLLNPLAHLPEVQSALRYAASEIAFALNEK